MHCMPKLMVHDHTKVSSIPNHCTGCTVEDMQKSTEHADRNEQNVEKMEKGILCMHRPMEKATLCRDTRHTSFPPKIPA
jgi:hypothetical protein